MTPEEMAELWPRLTDAERAEVEALSAAGAELWTPNPGGQEMVRRTRAKWTYYGGEAGGGKSYAALGLAACDHQISVIFRREFTDLGGAEGLIETSHRVLGGLLQTGQAKYNANEHMWRLHYGGRLRFIEFAGCQFQKDVWAQQGRARDLYVFDEAPQFARAQIEYITGWNRSRDPNQHTRILLTGNPPTSAEGLWIVAMFAPWIDPRYPGKRALPGELRWFLKDNDGRDVEVPDATPRVIDGKLRHPSSRTFVPSHLTENPTYANGTYAKDLDALPEPLRTQLKEGRFDIGLKDDDWQVFPSTWVRAAMERWKRMRPPEVLPDVAALDVAQGGSARTVLAVRRRNYVERLRSWPGVETKTGADVAAKLLGPGGLSPKTTPLNVDAIGVGQAPLQKLRELSFRVRGINVGEATEELARNRVMGFVNLRAFAMWSLREALDPEQPPGPDGTIPEPLALPDDPELFAELVAHRWGISGARIAVEKKEKVIERLGRSPDKAEAVYLLYAVPILQLVTGRGLGGRPVYSDPPAGY